MTFPDLLSGFLLARLLFKYCVKSVTTKRHTRKRTIKILNVKDPEREEYVVTLTIRSVGESNALEVHTTRSHDVVFDDDDGDEVKLPAAFATMYNMLTLAYKSGLVKENNENPTA